MKSVTHTEIIINVLKAKLDIFEFINTNIESQLYDDFIAMEVISYLI